MGWFSSARDPVSSCSHGIGAVLSAVGTLALVIGVLQQPEFSGIKMAAVLIFGCSLIGLYAASSCYHYAQGTPEQLMPLRKLDHAMIYLLIAGSYTPVLLLYFTPPHRTIFLIVIWAIASAGIVLKLCWFQAPRWLSTVLYLAMGWAILFDLPSLSAIPHGEIGFLLAGGIFYSIGGVIYGLQKPNFTSQFGFHELFHIFVLLGSLMHFLGVQFYIVTA